jgi:hypothetical protein
MWRDLYRRLIDFEHFDQAFTEATSILRNSNRGTLSPEEAAAHMLAVHSEALRHRPPEREIPPLPADQVGIDEAMAVTRRAICGEGRIELERPWREVFHCYGHFEIDGWKLIAFKRSRGIQYLDRAAAPDGRVGTYDAWSEREGNPVYMLSDDEQDHLDDVIEGSEPS